MLPISLYLSILFYSCRFPILSNLPLTCSVLSVPILHPPLSFCLFHPSQTVSLPGWVPAVELVGLVACVTARLSGVACDQGGRRAARTIGAERLRLTAGHLSRAISVGAEARSPLVGPAYCEDQRQSVYTLHSALSPSLLSHLCLQPSLSLPPVVVCCLSISLSFPPMRFCSSLANGCCLAICYPAVQFSLHYMHFDLFATSVEPKSYNAIKTHHIPMLLFLFSGYYLILLFFLFSWLRRMLPVYFTLKDFSPSFLLFFSHIINLCASESQRFPFSSSDPILGP